MARESPSSRTRTVCATSECMRRLTNVSSLVNDQSFLLYGDGVWSTFELCIQKHPRAQVE